MFYDRYHDLFFDDRDTSVYTKQLMDLKRLGFGAKEAELKRNFSVLNPGGLPPRRSDSVGTHAIGLRSVFGQDKSGQDPLRHFQAQFDKSLNESKPFAQQKRSEVAKLFAQGLNSLEKPKSKPYTQSNNPLAWVEANPRPTISVRTSMLQIVFGSTTIRKVTRSWLNSRSNYLASVQPTVQRPRKTDRWRVECSKQAIRFC